MLTRARGCLLGQLAGDSLGSLVEFRSREEIVAEYPGGVRELRDGGTWHTLAGQPTDDGELALSLARTLARERRWDAEAVLQSYVEWYDSQPFDMGNTTATSLGAAARAPAGARVAAAQAAARTESQANGALMRVAPLGVFAATRGPAQAAAWAREDAALTHGHPVCLAASAAYTAAIAVAVAGGDAEAAYAAALAHADQAAVHGALTAARGAPPADMVRSMGWALLALQNAFYQALHAGTLEDGVVATVMRGGDTDTNAAIAGGLLGALHGEGALPAQWRAALLECRATEPEGARHPRPPRYWPVDACELADALAAGPA